MLKDYRCEAIDVETPYSEAANGSVGPLYLYNFKIQFKRYILRYYALHSNVFATSMTRITQNPHTISIFNSSFTTTNDLPSNWSAQLKFVIFNNDVIRILIFFFVLFGRVFFYFIIFILYLCLMFSLIGRFFFAPDFFFLAFFLSRFMAMEVSWPNKSTRHRGAKANAFESVNHPHWHWTPHIRRMPNFDTKFAYMIIDSNQFVPNCPRPKQIN